MDGDLLRVLSRILHNFYYMTKNPLIRTIYLYLFALVGLVLMVIGAVNFINMGLKAWVFTQADQEQTLWDAPPKPYGIEEKIPTDADVEKIELTETEKQAIKNWVMDYDAWNERTKNIDVAKSRRHREAARNLSFLIVGMPLYLYHWGVIKKETKKDKENA
ncbi:MAG TPA: hypothetical protein DCY48_01180 [Candidatus Magasanikbacteria bacterium]|nr:MAG: hypothetical protein A3I74_03650 [Candidatus Magasanikbacteria bacterium RIFCSPLOWO2_02_FULL_47_16]OGH80172.1 MAG: hypothetical protein A3C10_03235 [Candidatus Magasanikbacteria bacterium RIFCSPHIGHO2_02_FULL_48_18]OGH82858.1 MAG: hypothetical protein A3G08_02790 [Candidatus Magasanikbacteria bacterium RIFCSPLOWO2_12_FULL_47_9b]HAZ28370.1 hypothetical protein [Candidatus Magasanikbacteria bacterium]